MSSIFIDTGSIGSGYEGRAFYANGLYWVFYTYDIATNWDYQWSSDGSTWSGRIPLTTSGGIGTMAFTVVGTKIYYANTMNGSYRSGTLNGDGSITWDGSEDVTSFYFFNPTIAIDSNGKAFIAGGGTDTDFEVVSNVTGSWAQTTLSRVSAVFNVPQITALTNGQMAVVVSDYNGDYPDIFIFDGSSWTQKTPLIAKTYGMLYSDIVGTNYTFHDQVQGAFWDSVFQTIDYVSYDVQNDSWTTPFTITSSVAYPSAISVYENTLVIGYSESAVQTIAARTSYFQGAVWESEFTVSTAPYSPFNFIGFYFTTLPQKFSVVFDVASGGIYSIDDPLSSNVTVTDTAYATDSISIEVTVIPIVIIDYATATDSIVIYFAHFATVVDRAYAQDFISVARFTDD